MTPIKRSLSAAALAVALSAGSAGGAGTCPFAQQRPMLVIRLYFGEDIGDRRVISREAWNAFLRDEVTPRFGDGFTIYDAYGQWMDPNARRIAREPSKVVEIAVAASPDVARRIDDIVREYRRRLHQQSVGIVTTQACASF